MKKSSIISPKRIAWLRQRLQRCEQHIIETAQWDVNYFYDGCLIEVQRNRLLPLFKNRRQILNEMFRCTDNEIARIKALNAQLLDATNQMYQDVRNLYKERLNMDSMVNYNDNTHMEARLEFHYYGDDAILPMPEDAYYGSKFSQMLNLLAIEDFFFTYPWCATASKVLDVKDKTINIDDLPELQNTMSNEISWSSRIQHSQIGHIILCNAVHDIFDHHLYSLPDIIHMNSFKLKIIIEQQYDLYIA